MRHPITKAIVITSNTRYQEHTLKTVMEEDLHSLFEKID